jgi:NADPH:quinone reductase-like Zn-dependent oxidoreductase
MANSILVTGAAGRVGAVGRTVTGLLLKQGKAVRAMVRNEDERAQALRDMGAESWSGICSISIRCTG